MQTPHGTVKVHFLKVRHALAWSVDHMCTAGARSASGKVCSWIAHVAKATPTETTAQAAARIAQKV